jgi:hypothetical protein
MNQFIKNATAEVGKTEKQIVTEKVENFLENAAIDCEMQIHTIKVKDIPTVEMQIKKNNVGLAKAKENYEKVRFQTACNFETYVQNREQAKELVEYYANEASKLNNNLEKLNAELKEFESMFSDLTSK